MVVCMVSLLRKLSQQGWLVAFFMVGICCWLLFGQTLRRILLEPRRTAQHEVTDADPEVDSTIPHPSLSPSDVVTKQVDSIRASLRDSEKLIVCYSLASVENRKQTGPLSRFAQLVMTAPYDKLAKSEDWQLGSTTFADGFAAVLVSTTSKEGDLSAFRFILHKGEGALSDCWLTEGVYSLELATGSPKAEPTLDEENAKHIE
jgi:hypothetical protein